MSLKGSRENRQGVPDEMLLKEYLKGGDLSILGELYSRYMHLVYGVCLKYLGERELARDAVMSIFEKVVTELGRHQVENFRPWLYVMSRNFCLMQLRSSKSENERFRRLVIDQRVIMENDLVMHPIDSNNGIDDRALDDCIGRLKDEQRECIRLFYYENRSYREVAELLGLDENRVKSHLQNAKRNLKICLEESYVEE